MLSLLFPECTPARVWAEMAWRSVAMAAPLAAPLSASLAAPLATPLVAFAALLASVACRVPTLEPVRFEAAFQGRCGEGSPCEQLCRELHDGTYECGCGPGYVLHVDGYGCLELNATKSTESSGTKEDVLYQKDVSFSAELEIAPSNRINKTIVSEKHSEEKILTTSPTIQYDIKETNYTYTGEISKQIDGFKSLIEDGVSKTDINIISEDKLKEANLDNVKVTTLGPSLEQKVPGATVAPPWTAAVESCDCDSCNGARCSCPLSNKCKSERECFMHTPRPGGGRGSYVGFSSIAEAYPLNLSVPPTHRDGTTGTLSLSSSAAPSAPAADAAPCRGRQPSGASDELPRVHHQRATEPTH
ncbi:hypothetical protein RR46_01618 [Papilio xuthus]|uniref:Uncharacterized protein n=1 Tax=Papilio xuthus TaxID=66420 RepID=A0A0N1IDD8_PAPXU|nr:hypothetical protein RR46_01618 [Papilio xuthus]